MGLPHIRGIEVGGVLGWEVDLLLAMVVARLDWRVLSDVLALV